MKQIYVFFFVFFPCFLHAEYQISYFKRINEAEARILKSDYETALIKYQTVFEEYKFNFYKDVHNACICAIKLEKTKEAFDLARKLILSGYELKDFNKEPFDYLKNEILWENFIIDYQNIRDEYLKTIDTALREKYYELFLEDQIAANHEDGKTIKEADSMFYNLSVNISYLIEKNGFPDWMTKKDTMSMKLMVMLSHYCGMENRIKENPDMQNDDFYSSMQNDNIRKLVDNAFKNCLISPEFYVSITTYHLKKNPYGKIGFKIDNELEKVIPTFEGFGTTLTEKEIAQINRNRESIGLSVINPNDLDNLINQSWIMNYPFSEIKKMREECENCTGSEIGEKTRELVHKTREDYYKSIKNSYFIINSIK